MISKLRAVVGRLFTPLARTLLRWGVSPDAVTIVGTVGVVVAALVLFPRGHLFAGTMVCWFFAMSDAIDGLMARLSGRTGPWGAFLDSTLDRIADGAIFTGLVLYLAGRGEDPLGAGFGLAEDRCELGPSLGGPHERDPQGAFVGHPGAQGRQRRGGG